jgi:hypothetical protein
MIFSAEEAILQGRKEFFHEVNTSWRNGFESNFFGSDQCLIYKRKIEILH